MKNLKKFSTDEKSLQKNARELKDALVRSKRTLMFVESCTGGRLAQLMTEVPGASEVFRGSLVVYTNWAKKKWAKVSPDVLKKYTAVSGPCALSLSHTSAARNGDLVIGVTGNLGPTGIPDGQVWISLREKRKSALFECDVSDLKGRVQRRDFIVAFVFSLAQNWLQQSHQKPHKKSKK